MMINKSYCQSLFIKTMSYLGKAKIVGVVEITGGGTGGVTAADARSNLGILSSNIPFTPTGNIAATTVQAALAEVDSEKLAVTSYTANDVLSKLVSVDGPGSNVDADLLDGQQGSYYSPTTHNHSGVYEPVNANIAKVNVAQTWTASQRTKPLSDNDGSFDMNAGNDFTCTPTGAITLTFTNKTTGQKGSILLNNTSNYVISLGTEMDADSGCAGFLSVTGKYWLNYWCYDGTNVALVYSGALI